MFNITSIVDSTNGVNSVNAQVGEEPPTGSAPCISMYGVIGSKRFLRCVECDYVTGDPDKDMLGTCGGAE